MLHQPLPAYGFCPDECRAVTSLLSTCFLPPLTTPTNNDLPERPFRNITRQPQYGGYIAGPETAFVTNTTQAGCFCTEGRKGFEACLTCLGGQFVEIVGSPVYDEYLMMTSYIYDCGEFGYFDNVSLAYPSTTRTALPSVTLPPSDLVPGGTACKNDICGVVRGQIAECGLTPIEVDKSPEDRLIFSDSLLSGTRQLWNRTAAECMCTTEVLRRLPGCQRCLEGSKAQFAGIVMTNYMWECDDFGYWNFQEMILPPSTSVDTAPAPTGTSTPKPNVARRAGPGGERWLWFSALLAWFCWCWASSG